MIIKSDKRRIGGQRVCKTGRGGCGRDRSTSGEVARVIRELSLCCASWRVFWMDVEAVAFVALLLRLLGS